jgi:hypothetical protein
MFDEKMSEAGGDFEGGDFEGGDFVFYYSFVGHDFPLTTSATCLSFLFLV